MTMAAQTNVKGFVGLVEGVDDGRRVEEDEEEKRPGGMD